MGVPKGIYMTLAEASNYIFKKTGVNIPKATLYTWSVKGKTTPDARRIRLKTAYKFGRVYVTKTQLENFLREMS